MYITLSELLANDLQYTEHQGQLIDITGEGGNHKWITSYFQTVVLLQVTQLKIKYNPFAKGFRGSELCGPHRRYIDIIISHKRLSRYRLHKRLHDSVIILDISNQIIGEVQPCVVFEPLCTGGVEGCWSENFCGQVIFLALSVDPQLATAVLCTQEEKYPYQ